MKSRGKEILFWLLILFLISAVKARKGYYSGNPKSKI